MKSNLGFLDSSIRFGGFGMNWTKSRLDTFIAQGNEDFDVLVFGVWSSTAAGGDSPPSCCDLGSLDCRPT